MNSFSRRRVLRGVVGGSAVTVGLPLLNCFLNGNGTALANGAPMPVRFATWYWALGMQKKIFVPKTVGANYDLPEELQPLKDVKQHINVYSDFDVLRDSSAAVCHYTGWVALRCGAVPKGRGDLPSPSLDVYVAQKIGTGTRFPALYATATGNPTNSYSFRGPNALNPSVASPLELYNQVFGADFQDPNTPVFTPNPRVMVKRSVLSGVLEQAKDLERNLGSEDRARMDQYFTGLRDLERQLAGQLEKPRPIAACRAPTKPAEIPVGLPWERIALRHKLMTEILQMAVVCDQTRVVNMVGSSQEATKEGVAQAHHNTTHEEPVDEALGYQPLTSFFTRRAMDNWAQFVGAFANAKEGDGTVLDNMLIYADSDQSYARVHGLDGLPMFTAGRAGGRLKTGIHVNGAHTPGSRVGYTALRTMGVDMEAWGAQSNRTSKEVGEVVV